MNILGKSIHPGPQKKALLPDPKHWVSPIPFGLGKVKPKHIRDGFNVLWENKDNLGYATNIITKGVCDGCALGVSGLTIKHWQVHMFVQQDWMFFV